MTLFTASLKDISEDSIINFLHVNIPRRIKSELHEPLHLLESRDALGFHDFVGQETKLRRFRLRSLLVNLSICPGAGQSSWRKIGRMNHEFTPDNNVILDR